METIYITIAIIGVIVLILVLICFFILCSNVSNIQNMLKSQVEVNKKIADEISSLNRRGVFKDR